MSDSIEYLTLVRCRDKLVTAFKQDAVTVADTLVSSNLIPPAVSSEIGELAISERKASRLVDCIFAKVEISHSHYNNFIAVFSQYGWLSDIVEILTSTHRELFSAAQDSDGIRRSSLVQSKVGTEIIRSNEEEIRMIFSSLLLSVQKSLVSQSVDFSDVQHFLVGFFQQSECFHSLTTFSEIFAATTVNRLWDYQHYSPLERLTKKFLPSDQEIAASMTEYKANLTGFFLVTKIVDYIKYKGLEADDATEQPLTMKKLTPNQYRRIKVVLQLERRVSELSLHYVHNLWCSFADEYELPCLTTVIDKIVAGSLEVSWLVLSHLIGRITPRSKFFRRHQIILVLIDDVILYDEKKMPEYEKELQLLCAEGRADLSQFSDILNRGVDPDIHDEAGGHPLWYAVDHKRADLVQLLIDNKADVDLATINDDFAETALILACSDGEAEIASILVNNGANVHLMNKYGQSPLWKASYYGYSTIVALVLQHNAQVDLPTNDKRGETALCTASGHGHLQTAILLLQHGAVVNSLTKQGYTPLYFACKNGHMELVDLLLARGAEVNKGLDPPLYTACEQGRVEIVRRLIQHGADVNLPTADKEFGSTPLGAACGRNHIDVATVLLESRAVVDSQDKNGMSALHHASQLGNVEIVRLLLKYHAKLEITNNEGRTALMLASWRGYLVTVVELLRAGAKSDAQDPEGLTSLMLAIQNGHTNVVKALLDAKADPNVTDKTSAWTALFFAAKLGNLEIVQHLIAKSAAVDIKDKNEVTALDIAELHGFQDICQELEKRTSHQRETKKEITEDQKKQVKKSYQRLLRIFDFLEETLLRGRKEKTVHQTIEKKVSSNNIEASQQQVDDNF